MKHDTAYARRLLRRAFGGDHGKYRRRCHDSSDVIHMLRLMNLADRYFD